MVSKKGLFNKLQTQKTMPGWQHLVPFTTTHTQLNRTRTRHTATPPPRSHLHARSVAARVRFGGHARLETLAAALACRSFTPASSSSVICSRCG